jgi:integrase
MSKDTKDPTPAAAQLAALLQSPDVLAKFGEFLAAQVGVGVAKPLVSDLWARYERHGTTPVGAGRLRIKSWNSTARYFARHLLTFFGGKAWDEVNHELADEYRRWRRETNSNRGKPVCHATINRELMTLLACFSHAAKKNIIPRNPLAGMPREVETHERAFTITIDQLKGILQHSRPWLRSYLMLLFDTGCRRNEIRFLEWPWVDLDRGFITIPKERAKNGRERMIPLSTVARMILEGMPRDPVSPLVFPNPHGPAGPIGKTTLWRWFREACSAAGITGPTDQPVWLHTLRHTWATDFVTRGGDVYTMMSIGGWTDPSVVQRYVNIAARHKEAAKELLDERSASLLPTVRKGPQRVVTSSEVRGGVAARVAKK